MGLDLLHHGLLLGTSGTMLPLVASADELSALGIEPWPSIPGEAAQPFSDESVLGLFERCDVHAQYLRSGDRWLARLTVSGVCSGTTLESVAVEEADQVREALSSVLGPAEPELMTWKDERVSVSVHIDESGYWTVRQFVRITVHAVG